MGGGGCHKIGRGEKGAYRNFYLSNMFFFPPPSPPPHYIGNDQVLRVLLIETSLSFICALK